MPCATGLLSLPVSEESLRLLLVRLGSGPETAMDFFKSAFTGLVPGAHEDVQRANNQGNEEVSTPQTYDVEEYTR